MSASTNQANRVKEVYLELVSIEDSEARDAALERLTGGDISLKQQVLSLLHAEEEARTGLLDRVGRVLGGGALVDEVDITEALAVERASTEKIDLARSPMIGPYKLMEQIGEGGMGVVYVAEQQHPLRRMVALKLIKPGMDSKQVVARFSAERQALAIMNHPNIAKVLDAGTTESGLPYFVMELVRGLPITKYCDQHELNLTERLNLFCTVCEAVQHAHQKGIIHRDLKPSNILVELDDVRSVPKVIDFGIAKAIQQPLTEGTLYTGISQMIGTPMYMSPEQAQLNSLDVDTRSDVYSLGVVLYELVTGQTPFEQELFRRATIAEMQRIIHEVEPALPSSRISTLRDEKKDTRIDRRKVAKEKSINSIQSELDWIVMKSLEKDRVRRYSSPQAIADDIRRFLDDEPILARPPSNWYRLSKVAKKYRPQLIVGLLLIVSLGVGLVVSVGQAIRATLAERRAEQQSAIANRAVDDMYSRFAEKWLSEQGTLTEVEQEFLEKALAFYSQEWQSGTDIQTVLEQLQAQSRVSAIQDRLGRHREAEENYRQVVEQANRLSERLTKGPEQVHARLLSATASSGLSSMLRVLGRDSEAEEAAVAAYAAQEGLKLADFSDEEQQIQLVNVAIRLTKELVQYGKLEQAERLGKHALERSQSLASRSPENWDRRLLVARAYAAVGFQHMYWGNNNSASIRAYEESERILSELVSVRPLDRECRTTLNSILDNLGVVSGWEKRLEEAVVYQRRAVKLAAELAGHYPQDHKLQQSYANSLGNLAGNLIKLDKSTNGAEVLELRQRELSTQAKLVESLPDSGFYWARFVKATAIHSATHFQLGNPEQGDQALADLAVKIQQGPFAGMNDKNDDRTWIIVAYDAAAQLFRYSGRLLDRKRYADAARTLDAIPALARKFDPEWIKREVSFMHPATAGQDQRAHAAQLCKDEHKQLLGFSVAYSKCASLVRQDLSLDDERRDEMSRSYQKRSDAYREQAENALSAWLSYLSEQLDVIGQPMASVFTTLSGYEQEIHLDSLSSELQREALHEATHKRWARLIEYAAERYPDNNKFLVYYLVAAPLDWRDAELGLQIARSAYEKKNYKQTQQCLVWALFGAGRCEECLASIANMNSSKDGQVDLEVRAIQAMALWHLGERQKAKQCLEGDYEQKLAEFVQRWEDSIKEKRILPEASHLKRLDLEAKQLISDLPSR